MKIFLFVLLSLYIPTAFSLGDPNYNPLHLSPNEYQSINDMGETTYRMGQWSNERGYQDQQMMDEDPELLEEEIREKKIKDEKLMNQEYEKLKINRE
jgi:hypothetical protein